METIKAIYGRRSIRKYKPDDIRDEDLKRILDAGMMAPSGVNKQPWFFVVVKSDEKRKELMDAMAAVAEEFEASLKERFPKNPEVVVDTTAFIRSLGGAPVIVLAFSNRPETQMNAVLQSVAAAIQNMLLAAYDMGIGSCWLTSPLGTSQRQVLQERYGGGHGEIIAVITLGYPVQQPKAPARKANRYEII